MGLKVAGELAALQVTGHAIWVVSPAWPETAVTVCQAWVGVVGAVDHGLVTPEYWHQERADG